MSSYLEDLYNNSRNFKTFKNSLEAFTKNKDVRKNFLRRFKNREAACASRKRQRVKIAGQTILIAMLTKKLHDRDTEIKKLKEELTNLTCFSRQEYGFGFNMY